MDRGWVKLWIKSLDSDVFVDPNLWKLWTWCLMKARRKKGLAKVQTGRGHMEVKLNPGQFIFGRHIAAKQLHMKASSVRNRMEKLKNMGALDTQSGTHYSIVTIRNWELYQPLQELKNDEDGHPEDNEWTPIGHIRESIEGIDNKKKGAFSLPSQEQIDNFAEPTIDDQIKKVSDELYYNQIFKEAPVFAKKMLKEGKNKRAILYTLTACFMKGSNEGFDSRGPWGYCRHIIDRQSGNYYEAEANRSN